MQSKPLTIRQFAARHRISRQRVWQLIQDGRIPSAYRTIDSSWARADPVRWAIPGNAEIIRGRR